MLIEATDDDFDALIAGTGPNGLLLAAGGIADTETLVMLRGLANRIRPEFRPAAWMIVEIGAVVGLCSPIAVPGPDASLNIGYGVAESWRNRGSARRAIADVIAFARADPRIQAVTAETATGNIPSQRVLAANGFARVGTAQDDEHGALICWRIDTTG